MALYRVKQPRIGYSYGPAIIVKKPTTFEVCGYPYAVYCDAHDIKGAASLPSINDGRALVKSCLDAGIDVKADLKDDIKNGMCRICGRTMQDALKAAMLAKDHWLKRDCPIVIEDKKAWRRTMPEPKESKKKPITERLCEAVLRLKRQGFSQREIASKMGICASSVQYIVRDNMDKLEGR